MALLDYPVMYLVILSLIEGKSKDPLSQSRPEWAVYREDMTQEELAEVKDHLIGMRILLESPASSDMMPLCPAWMCGKWAKALVKDGGAWGYYPTCKWYDKCKPYETDPNRGSRYDNR